jgi:hypothetical protein
VRKDLPLFARGDVRRVLLFFGFLVVIAGRVGLAVIRGFQRWLVPVFDVLDLSFAALVLIGH